MEINYDLNIANRVAKLSFEKFEQLPKKGKPNLNEWSILACIVKHDTKTKQMNVVALGTGSKCIGKSKLSTNGDILNDSHAEVICRRAFLRYIYNQLDLTIDHNESVLNFNKNSCSFDLKSNIKFHFFCTQVPCGDASIFAKDAHSNEFIGLCVNEVMTNNDLEKNPHKNPLKRANDSNEENAFKKYKFQTITDIHRTGAKCLKAEIKQDSYLEGSNYHTLGTIRTKPGRGDPTQSVSCSDKLARWTRVGIQGALLTLLIPEPIYLSSIIIAKNTPYCEKAMRRALNDRFEETNISLPYSKVMPVLLTSDLNFKYSKTNNKQPCPSSIIWCDVQERALEVSIEGKKQGITKKNTNSPTAQLSICKKQLGIVFLKTATKCNILVNLDMHNQTHISYKTLKHKAKNYYKTWEFIKKYVFKVWTEKDDFLLHFNLTINYLS